MNQPFTLDTCEQYVYYRVPKLLITDNRYSDVSADAKLLYGLMLDRMSLSRKNEWVDGNGYVYIYYGQDEIMADMNCREGKVAKMIKELRGVGLITFKNQGQGKSRIIYVLNFTDDADATIKNETENMFRNAEIAFQENNDSNIGQVENARKIEPETYIQNKAPEHVSSFQKCENRISRNAKIASQEMRKSHLKKCENRIQNNNNNNYNNLSENPSIYPSSSNRLIEGRSLPVDVMRIKEIISKQIGCGAYALGSPESDRLNELAGILTEIHTTTRRTWKIQGDDIPIALLRSAFGNVSLEDAESVFRTIDEQGGKIQNMKGYIVATLYNHMLTKTNAMQHQITLLVGK